MHFEVNSAAVPTAHPRLLLLPKMVSRADMGYAPATVPGGDFEASLETYGALDVCAVLGAERRLDIATDFLQGLCDRFDVRVAQVRILSYFCDRDAASHPNSEMGRGIG